jgi:hypothetical protein
MVDHGQSYAPGMRVHHVSIKPTTTIRTHESPGRPLVVERFGFDANQLRFLVCIYNSHFDHETSSFQAKKERACKHPFKDPT